MKNLKQLIISLALIIAFSGSVALADRTFSLPDQTGQAGRSLHTDGTNPLWAPDGGGALTIGQPVIAATPDWILYVDNAGNIFGDNLATRDSATNETHIGKDDGTFTSEHLLIDITGLGDWAAGIARNANNPLDFSSAAYATVNGTALGSPDSAVAFSNFSDTTGNITGINVMDSIGWVLTHDNVATNTARMYVSSSQGWQARFDDGNSANTFNNAFFINSSGLGWSDLLGGTNFFLPLVDGSAGDALVTDGAGNLSFATVAGGIIQGATVTGCGAKEVIYTSNTNTVACDPLFYRDSVTNESLISTAGVQANYTTSLVMDSSLFTGLLLSHIDPINTVGSTILMRDTRNSVFWRDNTLQILAGLDVDSVGGGTPSTQIAWQDGIGNTLSRFRATGASSRMEYSDVAGTGTRAIMDGTQFYVDSDVPGTNCQQLLLNFTMQTVGMGDMSNCGNGIGVFSNDPLMFSGLGDVAGSQMGIAVATDNINGFAVLGSVSGGTGNGTLIGVDDVAQGISGSTGSDILFSTDISLGSIVRFGYKAGNTWNSIGGGTGDTLIGYNAGVLIDTANDNTGIGLNALSSNTGGHSNTCVGVGCLATLNDSGASDAEYNNAFGREAGDNITTGSYNNLFGYNTGQTLTTGRDNILIGNSANVSTAGAVSRVAIGFSASATADYQVMFGGSGSPFSEFVLGGNQSQSGFAGHDVLMRTIFSNGTDIAGGDFNIQPGLATGNAATGDIQFKSAVAGATGTTLQTASNWGRISPRRVRFGDLDSVGGNTTLDINDTAGNLYIQANATNLFQVNSDRILMNGSMQYKRTAVNDADKTINANEYLISMENLSASRTVTVPDASTAFAGRTYIIKDADCLAGTWNIILDPAGTDTIDNASTFTMNVNCQAITVTSDGGTNWEII